MYGLVNKGLEDLIRSAHGDAAWLRICAAAGVPEETFASMRSYPDELTYRLVASASAELGVDVDTLLERFGAHWVLYTGAAGYGALFDLAGGTVEDVLTNLDGLHGRIEHTFPAYQMPHFTCEREPDGALRLRYRSIREGLAPMVRGLVRGLGEKFGTPVTIEHVARRGVDAAHDEFLLRVAPR